jgi:hypothetical protein
MKATTILAGAIALATRVAAHATFQALWVNGVDKIGCYYSWQTTLADSAAPGYMRKTSNKQQSSYRRNQHQYQMWVLIKEQ